MTSRQKQVLAAVAGSVVVVAAMFGSGYISLSLIDLAAVAATLLVVGLVAIRQADNSEDAG